MTITITAYGSPRSTVAAGNSDKLRTDIQALRGLAVLLVVLQHSSMINSLKAGYLGVDIFFVVSGYLITGIVQRGLQAGSFSFAEFYFRRAKRLLPAAYVVFAATALVSPLFLTQSEMIDFSWQLAGAATFTGNIALWLQTGYFENAALLKPLLHVWSLSIEEQYYLLLPLTLALTPQRYWRAGSLAVFAASLTLCLALGAGKPSATFYLLPTRAWELALGSVGTLVFASTGRRVVLAWLFWPAVAVLMLLPFFPTRTPHPGMDALLVCTATLIVILRRHPRMDGKAPVVALARLGDMSYSLYLVHWPVLALAADAWVSSPPILLRVVLLVVTISMAWLLYRYIEQPVRQAAVPVNKKSVLVALSGTVAVAMAGFVIAKFESRGVPVDYSFTQRVNLGLGPCEFGNAYQPSSKCQNSDTPKILLWGDSFAMHLANGIAASTANGLAQATKSVCGPLLNLSAYEERGPYNRRWADDCLAFNRSVLHYVASTPSIEVVVLASTFSQARTNTSLLLVSVPPAAHVESAGNQDAVINSLRATIDAVRATGKRVVIVAPPPTSTFNIGRCLELKGRGKAIFGADNPSCSISEGRYRSANSEVLSLLARVEQEAQVAVVRFDDLLCQAGTCSVELQGTPLYRDFGHFSVDGGILVGRRLNLGGRVMAEAR